MTRSPALALLLAAAIALASCGSPQDSRLDGRSLGSGKALRDRSASAVSVPTVVNPSEELEGFAPTGILRWTQATGADVYEVWTYADAGLTQQVETSGALRSREYQFRTLQGGRSYYAKLYYRVSGVWGELPVLVLTTVTEVTKARLLNPQDELEALSPAGTLRWSPVPGADVYELWLFRDASLSALAETSGAIRETQYQVRYLAAGRSYFAKVFSRVDGTWVAGDPLPVTLVDTYAKARLLNPQEELDAFVPGSQLRWSPVTGASAYEVWIYTDPTLSEVVESSGSLVDRSYATRSLVAGRTYHAWVLAKVGEQWQAGAAVRLTTVATATRARLTNAQNELDGFATGGTLRWSEVPGASAYELWIYTSPGLTNVVESAHGGADRSYQVTKLCKDAPYYVKIFTLLQGEWTSGWATRLNVTQGESAAGCVPPSPVVSLAAQPDEVVAGGRATLRWSASFANACTASGAWSGEKPTSGEQQVGPLDAESVFTLVCSGPSGVSKAEALVTIAPPRMAVSDASRHEGDDGQTWLTFTVTLDRPAVGHVVVDLETAPGTATADVDYEPLFGNLDIPPGWTSHTVSVPIRGDVLVEGPETLELRLSNARPGITLDDAVGVGTIVDDDPGLAGITIADAKRVEGDDGRARLVFAVSLSRVPRDGVVVGYETVPGSATGEADYRGVAGTLSMAGGEVDSGVIDVEIVGDRAVEGDETLELRLSNPSSNAVIVDGVATGTIVDDDGAAQNPVAISIEDRSQPEGHGGAEAMAFTVVLDRAAGEPVEVVYLTSPVDAAPGFDFITSGGAVTVPPGETVATVVVPVLGDTAVETDETFEVRLSTPSAGAWIADDTAVGTIANDDPGLALAGVSIDDVTVVEGSGGGVTNIVFTLSLDRPAPGGSVELLTVPVTAQPGRDFTMSGGRVPFAAGETRHTVSFRVAADAEAEPPETFELWLSRPAGGVYLADGVGVGTIVDDDGGGAVVQVSVGDESQLEGNAGTKAMVFTVALDRAPTGPVSVNYRTVPGSASAGSDYTPVSGTLQIPAGTASGTISVPIFGDTAAEPNETFAVQLSNPSANAAIADGLGIGTILDDGDGAGDQHPTAGIWYGDFADGSSPATFPAKVVVTETGQTRALLMGRGAADPRYSMGQLFGQVPTTGTRFEASLTGVLYYDNHWSDGTRVAPVKLDSTVTPGLAWNGAFRETTGSGTFAFGYQQGTYERPSSLDLIAGDYAGIQIHDDAVDPNGYTVNLSIAADGTLGGGDSRGCSYDGAVGLVNPTRNYYELAVTIANCPVQNGRYSGLAFFDGTGEEYTRLFYMANDGDAIWTGAVSRQAPALVGIAISGTGQLEGNSGTRELVFTVTLDRAPTAPVTVQFQTAAGTATAGSDYATTAGTLAIAAGQATATIPVPVFGDAEVEPDETLTVQLSSPSANATLVTASAVGTIVNDDGAVTTSSVRVADASTPEGDSGTRDLVFTVTLEPVNNAAVELGYSTAAGTATADSDFARTVGTLTIPAGQATATIRVPVIGDTRFESNETFALYLTENSPRLVLADAQAIGTIANDDVRSQVSVADASTPEGDSGTSDLVFTLTLNPVNNAAVELGYSTTAGTATSDVDFTRTTGTLTIPAGQATATIRVPLIGDTRYEPDETLAVYLTETSPNLELADAQAVGTIVNDDVRSNVSIADASMPEGHSGTTDLVFTVTLNPVNNATVELGYSTTSGTASADSDFTRTTGTLTIPAGQATATIRVPVIGDTRFESNETFAVYLTETSPNLLLADGQAVGLIVNDD